MSSKLSMHGAQSSRSKQIQSFKATPPTNTSLCPSLSFFLTDRGTISTWCETGNGGRARVAKQGTYSVNFIFNVLYYFTLLVSIPGHKRSWEKYSIEKRQYTVCYHVI